MIILLLKLALLFLEVSQISSQYFDWLSFNLSPSSQQRMSIETITSDLFFSGQYFETAFPLINILKKARHDLSLRCGQYKRGFILAYNVSLLANIKKNNYFKVVNALSYAGQDLLGAFLYFKPKEECVILSLYRLIKNILFITLLTSLILMIRCVVLGPFFKFGFSKNVMWSFYRLIRTRN